MKRLFLALSLAILAGMAWSAQSDRYTVLNARVMTSHGPKLVVKVPTVQMTVDCKLYDDAGNIIEEYPVSASLPVSVLSADLGVDITKPGFDLVTALNSSQRALADIGNASDPAWTKAENDALKPRPTPIPGICFDDATGKPVPCPK